MNKISFYEYIATNVPSDAHFVINKYSSYRRARSPKELEYQLKNFVKNHGEKGLNALAEIHPDRKLLENNMGNTSDSNFSNFNSKGAEDYENGLPNRFVNADGQTQTASDILRADTIRNSQILIFGGMLLVAVALIVNKS